MNRIAIPDQARLHLDTTTHIHATDGAGKLIINQETGKPYTIAQDMISGQWYALAATGFPRLSDQELAELASGEHYASDLHAAGGVHVPHDDERYRGVWVPLEGIESEVEDTAGEEATPDDGTPSAPVVRRPRAAKKAVKKAAKKR
jgi:hypothetical protein